MNFLSFYQNNIYYELVNKFNYSNYNKEFKIHKLIISIKLTKTTLSYVIHNLLALEIIFLKKSFYLTVKTGTYFWIHINIINKTHINLFLIKYLWIIYPKLKNQQSVSKIKKQVKKIKRKESFFFFQIDFIKKFEYLFNENLTTHITFNLIFFNSIKSNKLFFFRKSFQLLKKT